MSLLLCGGVAVAWCASACRTECVKRVTQIYRPIFLLDDLEHTVLIVELLVSAD